MLSRIAPTSLKAYFLVLKYDNARQIFARPGAALGVASHTLDRVSCMRHRCGYKLANEGHDTGALGALARTPDIQNAMRYTDLAPGRFKDFWRH